MPLFIENANSIATAIVTIQRAIENQVIEEKKYEGLVTYLDAKKVEYGVTLQQINLADDVLDDELRYAFEDLYMEESDELANMAEEILNEHQRDFGKDDDDMLREAEAEAHDQYKQALATKEFLKG